MPKAQRIGAITVVTVVAVALLGGIVLPLIPAFILRGDRLSPHVRIAGVEVGGLPLAEARTKLQNFVGNPTLSLQAPERTWTVTLAEVGGQPLLDDVLRQAHALGREGNYVDRVKSLWRAWQDGQQYDLAFSFDEKKLRRLIWNLAACVNRAPVNGRLRIEGNQIVEVIDGRWGRRLNVDATVQRILSDYRLHHPVIPVVIEEKRPAVTAEDLRDINGIIGQFTTWFNRSKRNRTWNIRLVARVLDGAVIPPQHVFSFNDRTGSREAFKGYKVAQIYVNKKIVEGVGGGVCQVSTTLYNAALQAGLPIVQRHRHSLPVPYIRSGRDATVSYPHRDLQFKNNTDSPIYLQARVEGSRVTVALWGNVRREGRLSTQPRGTGAVRLTSRGVRVKISACIGSIR
ncbi:MAG: VanW family protein [Abditibacteriales bacterium]|nr:VanW family protein [Abditibacteriales bacterium]MDW8365059.1 VanW family protein [Abditibacteriales bacterium]